MTTEQIKELLERHSTNGVIIKGIPGSLLEPPFDGWYFEFLYQFPKTKRRAAKVKTRALDSLESFIERELAELNRQE